MAIQKFDELNTRERAEEIRDYFEVMELASEEVEERIKLCTGLDKAFYELFGLMALMGSIGYELESQRAFLTEHATLRCMSALEEIGYTDRNGYYENYIANKCTEIVDATLLHIADEYYLSAERSLVVSENETNAICNYEKEQQAIESGYTQKTWVTFKDDKVRKTHNEVDEQTISIFKPFTVGGFQMMFPHDQSLANGENVKECVNCRCVIKYKK